MQWQYYRIDDGQPLTVERAPGAALRADGAYTAVTYSIGLGAYGPDYSFFMDTGVMADGTPTAGKYGKAVSKQSVLDHTNGAIGVLRDLDADFCLPVSYTHLSVPPMHAPLPPPSVLQAMIRGILAFSCKMRFCSYTSAAVPGL